MGGGYQDELASLLVVTAETKMIRGVAATSPRQRRRCDVESRIVASNRRRGFVVQSEGWEVLGEAVRLDRLTVKGKLRTRLEAKLKMRPPS